MAVKKRARNRATYFAVRDGKIVRESMKPDMFEGADDVLTRVNKNGDTVYYQEFDSMEGKLVSVYTRVEDGRSDELHLVFMDTDDGSRMDLTLFYDSPYTRAFLRRMEDIDLTEPLEIAPYDFEGEDGRNVRGVSLIQNDERIPNLYTKDGLECPAPVKKKVKGKETWDFSEQEDFFWNKLLDFIEAVKAVNPEQVRSAAGEDDAPEEPPAPEKKAKKATAAKTANANAVEGGGEEEAPQTTTEGAPRRRTSSSKTEPAVTRSAVENRPPANIGGDDDEEYDDDLPF